jgi:hypothetical protein
MSNVQCGRLCAPITRLQLKHFRQMYTGVFGKCPARMVSLLGWGKAGEPPPRARLCALNWYGAVSGGWANRIGDEFHRHKALFLDAWLR